MPPITPPPGFEWDPAKATSNLAKHGVSFGEATQVFADDRALFYADELALVGEPRFLALGMSRNANMLVVVHCIRGNGNVVRIISARRATRRERAHYDIGAP